MEIMGRNNKKKGEGWSELMEKEDIPAEIIVDEILSRLPVKPPARFRSVCKSLNSIISSDPNFAILQLKNSSSSSSPITCFDRQRMLLWDTHDCSSAFFLVKKNFGFAIEKINTNPIEFIKGYSSSSYSILASCVGLVCIFDRSKFSVLFWNPLTGETKRVSDPPTGIPLFPNWVTYGLGYDSSTDDYKFIWIYHRPNDTVTGVPLAYEVGVFSLRTNSWRQIQHFPTQFCSLKPGVFFNGALYWAGYSKDSPDNPYKLVSLCLKEEEYTLLDIPVTDFWPRDFHIYIEVLGDKLAACYPSYMEGCYHLLLFNLCDNSKSWIKHTLTLPNVLWWFAPLCLLENVEEILFRVRGDLLVVYCLTDGTFGYLDIHGLPETFKAMTFSESLISPNTYKGKTN